MAAHRTWGLFFTAGGPYTQLSEVAFLSAADVDLSTGGTAGASSEYPGGYEAWRAFDKSNSTDWSNADGDKSRRLWYTRPSAVVVEKVRIRLSNTSYIPTGIDQLRLRWSDSAGATWGAEAFRLKVLSGAFVAAGTVILSVLPPLVLTPAPALLALRHNFQQPALAQAGVIASAVAFKAAPSAPEQPFANARVWLLRRADGRKAWEGYSDSAGNYIATGLEAGVEYIAVGIDPWGNHKATAAGPVLAVKAD